MQQKIRLSSLLVLMLLGLRVSAQSPQNTQKDKVLQQLLFQGLTMAHFAPQTVDDAFSEKAYALYIERLDYGKRYFLTEDIEEFNAYRTLLDNQYLAGQTDFFDLTQKRYFQRIREVEEDVFKILDKPFDLDKKETLELDGEKRSFLASEKERRELWRKILKQQVVARVADQLENQKKRKEKGEEVEEKSTKVLEKEAREGVLNSQKEIFRRMTELKREDILATYINAAASVYDPHTSYFPPKDKENFDIRMSGQLEGIGATLTSREGYVRIQRIVPGGPAWKQGDAEAEDIILKVAQGDEEPVSIVDMRLDEAVQLIRGKKGTEVRLTLKKVDETVKEISIIRDVVVMEETYAKSAVLEDNGHKLGYIYLPSFYADFSGKGGRSCAKDVRKEVEKLKAQNVEGIVLDLRNNGGGSLQDVVEMAGLFIEDGPIVQVKARGQQPIMLKDEDKKVVYDGPLAVMVNGFSASASEILAAAMQDYGRALIVGTAHTFGKGTVQRFVNLDQFIPGQMEDIKPLGDLKLTIQKFYRINGGATQMRGVIPDVVLPDVYAKLDYGEKDEEYTMPWDEIKAAKYKRYESLSALEALEANSQERVEENEIFQRILKNADFIKAQRDKTVIPISLAEYIAFDKARDKEAEQYRDMTAHNDDLAVLPLTEPTNEADDTLEEANKRWKKDLVGDVYLEEMLYIFRDMLEQGTQIQQPDAVQKGD